MQPFRGRRNTLHFASAMARLFPGNTPRCSIPPPFPSARLTKRRTNRLREKLLKTLPRTHQLSPISLPQGPIHRREVLDGAPMDDMAAIVSMNEQRLELSNRQSPTLSEVVHGVPGAVSSGFALRCLLQLVGLFIFQTICAVWFLGSGYFDGKTEEKDGGHAQKLGNSGLAAGRTRGNDGFLSENNGGHFNKSLVSKLGEIYAIGDEKFGEKISTIRLMAIEARLAERLEMGGNGDVRSGSAAEETEGIIESLPMESSMDSASRKIEKSQIKGEVDELLGELPRLVRSRLRKFPPKSYLASFAEGPRRSLSRNDMVGRKRSPASPAKDDLMNSGSGNPKGGGAGPVIRERPRGFQSKGGVVKSTSKIHIDAAAAFNGKLDKPADSALGGGKGGLKEVESYMEPSITSIEERESNAADASFQEAVERLGSGGNTSVSSYHSEGSVQDNLTKINGANRKCDAAKLFMVTDDPSRVTDVEAKPVKLENKKTRQSMKENDAKPTRSGGSAISKRNRGSKHTLQPKDVKHESQQHEGKDNQPGDNGFWWLSLPYIFVIFLHRGVGDKRSKGLYSVQIHHDADIDVDSHIITFEDRGDATNFCSLLESFFKDLGDAYADVVPLSIKELYKEVKSGSMNVKVVRKGQLHLYVGQPLEDVERKLRSL